MMWRRYLPQRPQQLPLNKSSNIFEDVPGVWQSYPHTKCNKGIIHVGAHRCEEKPYYDAWGISNVLWIDGNDELCAANESIVNAIVSDTDDLEVDFIITNNDAMSSSLLHSVR
jgi:hypothetical protein